MVLVFCIIFPSALASLKIELRHANVDVQLFLVFWI